METSQSSVVVSGLSPRTGLTTPPALPAQGMAISPTVTLPHTQVVTPVPAVTPITVTPTPAPPLGTTGNSLQAIGLAKPTTANVIETVKNRIAVLGPGPHTPQQKEELTKLQQHLIKLQASPTIPQLVTSKPGETPMMAGLPPVVAPVGTSSPSMAAPRAPAPQTADVANQRVLEKRRLTELVKEVDPLEQLDDDVEEMLMQIADDFIDNVVTAACQLAKHRKANTVEVKDVQLHLERNWNMWIPGFGSEELRPFKKAATTEAHKQRMALIKKTLKKY